MRLIKNDFIVKNVIGFGLGMVTANAFEWYAHKFLLHGTARSGLKRYSPLPISMNSHWTHHKMVRQTQFKDEGYLQALNNERNRLEIKSLVILIGAVGLVGWKINKGFVLASAYGAYNYYTAHRRSHLSPEYAKTRMPWHYDHHMNSQQDANWCVTRPWFDYIMGTRVASSEDLLESNPLGVNLPILVERPLNQILSKIFPKVFEKLRSNLKHEQQQKTIGVYQDMPDVDYFKQ